jgi:hypothetical protein
MIMNLLIPLLKSFMIKWDPVTPFLTGHNMSPPRLINSSYPFSTTYKIFNSFKIFPPQDWMPLKSSSSMSTFMRATLNLLKNPKTSQFSLERPAPPKSLSLAQ